MMLWELAPIVSVTLVPAADTFASGLTVSDHVRVCLVPSVPVTSPLDFVTFGV